MTQDPIAGRRALLPVEWLRRWSMRQDLKARPRAFSLVEWLLYVYAASSLIGELGAALSNGAVPLQNKLAIGLMIVFAILVLMRNYMVMHAIDNRDRHPAPELAFLDFNVGWEDVLERILRAAIVIVVVMSPKGLLLFAPDVVTQVVDGAYARMLEGLRRWGYETGQGLVDQSYAGVSYYGSVLFVLFLLFVLWDLVGMWAVGRGVRRAGASLGGTKPDPAFDPAVQSAIDYMNSPRLGEPRPWALERIRAGNLMLPYMASAKARERAAGLVFAALMIISGASGLSVLAIMAYGAVATTYLFAARRNGDYERGLKEFGKLPFRYLLTFRRTDQLVQASQGAHLKPAATGPTTPAAAPSNP